MKKSLPLLLSVPLLFSVLLFKPLNKIEPVNAYEKEKLPTTINLNDYVEGDIRSYYSNLNSLDESERKGQNLLKNLKPILSNKQKYYSYDSGNAIWQMYEITDRDWKKSPASSTTFGSYDSSTNTITDYVYGSSSSDKKNNPYVRALYVNRSIENPKTAWDAHTPRSNEACIEREHIWPKSHGFDDDSLKDGGARGDPMHLWAADGGSNGIHSNYFYGYVDKTKSYKNSKDDYSWTGDNLLGISKSFPSGEYKVFEPQDSDKGDIARACFYMVARYNNIAGDDSTIGCYNPNLALTNDVSKTEETGTSTPSVAFSLGVMKDLLEWNKLDPVDGYELHRNNLLCRNFTNNRNPFIDFPEWADYIWGDNAENKAASPSTDQIAEPKDFVPQAAKDDGLIFGIPKIYVYIAAGVLGAVIIIVVVLVLLKGSKKQKKTLKKIGKKAVKSSGKTKKKK